MPTRTADPATTTILDQARAYAAANSQGAARAGVAGFLRTWNDAQAGVLDDVVVTAIGAGFFAASTEPVQLWPHDGLVFAAQRSRRRRAGGGRSRIDRHSFPDHVHSIFFADAFGLPWERALTWDPRVFEVVDAARGI